MGKSISINKLCRCCMTSMDNANSVCPICGFDKEWYSAPREHLRLDFILASRYMVGTSLAEDDYEISYIGWDLSSNRKVHIKEYYPKGLVTREKSDEVAVSVEDRILAFEERVDQYLYMAEKVSKFNNISNMVKVVDYFGENHTAYIISEYPEGVTTEQYRERSSGRMQVEDVLQLMKPVLNILQRIHEQGMIHNSITPFNILITDDGDVKLMGLSPAVIFKNDKGKGPWIDTYDVCSTMYRLITGQYPGRSNEENRGRGYSNDSSLIRPTWLGVDISPEVEEVILKGLSSQIRDRYKTVAELYERLYGVRQKGFTVNSEQVFAGEELNNQNVSSRIRERSTNQIKDGQCDMNDMNNMNGQRGMGQPRMNPNLNGQPRMNQPGMNQQARPNGNVISGQPRMNTTQVNINQRQNQTPPQVQPKQNFSQNTQRINNVPNARGPVNVQQPNQQAAFVNNKPAEPIRNQMPGQMPQNQMGAPRMASPIQPTPVMPQQQAPGVAPGMPRPGVPQQNMRPPFPGQQVNPQMNPQMMMRPANVDPMAMNPMDKNRRTAVALGRGKTGVNMAAGEKKLGMTTIITIVVCAIFIGITAYSVIKYKSGSNDNESKANNNTNVTENTKDKVSTSTNAPVSTPTPAPIEVYDIEWKSSTVEEYARTLTGISEGAISTKDLEDVTELKLGRMKIETAEDFVHFQRVKALDLRNNSIKDLSPFANMTSVEEINLSGNDLSGTDLSPLAKIASLKKVDLTNTKVSDYTVLSEVPLVVGRTCSITVEFYYTRPNSDYDDWNLWLWADTAGMQYDFERGDGYVKTTVEITTSVAELGYVIRKGDWLEKDVENNRLIPLESNQDVAYITVRANQGENDATIEYE